MIFRDFSILYLAVLSVYVQARPLPLSNAPIPLEHASISVVPATPQSNGLQVPQDTPHLDVPPPPSPPPQSNGLPGMQDTTHLGVPLTHLHSPPLQLNGLPSPHPDDTTPPPSPPPQSNGATRPRRNSPNWDYLLQVPRNGGNALTNIPGDSPPRSSSPGVTPPLSSSPDWTYLTESFKNGKTLTVDTSNHKSSIPVALTANEYSPQSYSPNPDHAQVDPKQVLADWQDMNAAEPSSAIGNLFANRPNADNSEGRGFSVPPTSSDAYNITPEGDKPFNISPWDGEYRNAGPHFQKPNPVAEIPRHVPQNQPSPGPSSGSP